jgi:hypothetical protein
VLFFPESSLLALQVCCRKPTDFRICDADVDDSVMLGSQIDSFLTESENFHIRICLATFLNDCSSKLQPIDGLFGVFSLNNFFSVQIILNLMAT